MIFGAKQTAIITGKHMNGNMTKTSKVESLRNFLKDIMRRAETMITFLLGFALGAIFGATGLVCVAIMYDKHHPNE